MDRKFIDDHHIVARYLADQLSDTEREAFEAYYLQNPEMVREMEAAARFKVGLAQLREGGQLDDLLENRRSPAAWWGLAASVAIVAIGAWLLLGRTSAPPLLVASSTALSAELGASFSVRPVRIERMRSATSASAQLASAPEALNLQVLPEFEATPSRYRIELAERAADNEWRTLGQVEDLTPDESGFVNVYVSSGRLHAGAYRIIVSGARSTDAADQSSEFIIRFFDNEP